LHGHDVSSRTAVVAGLVALLLAACSSAPAVPTSAPTDVPSVADALTPPVAERREHVTTVEGVGVDGADVEIHDDYYWLRERDNPEVIAYLEAENAYTEAMMAHTETLQQTLYQEMLGRIQETDLSVPYRIDEYWYYTRTEEGQAYGILCRRSAADDGSYDEEAEELVLLNQNELVEIEGEYLDVGDMEVSPDHTMLAYTVDDDGSEVYDIHVRDIVTGTESPVLITDTAGTVVWGNDNSTLFFTRQDEAHRPHQLWRQGVGSPEGLLMYQEDDERFFMWLEKTRSEQFVVVTLESAITTEQWIIDADRPLENPDLVAERSQGFEYRVEHHGDRFFIATNRGEGDVREINFRLVEAPVDDPSFDSWTEVIPHREDVQLAGVEAFADHLIIRERAEGVPRFTVRDLATGDEHTIEFPEVAYGANGDINAEFDADTFRLRYTSLVTPRSIFDYHIADRELELLKETPVLGGYDRDQYISERVWATASDGVRVPISLVYRAGLELDGSNPTYLVGYGSYGYPYDAYFSTSRLSLLDRGFVFAIAHIRGGGEMGRHWYEDGKFLNKRNTFTDFIASAEHLIAEGYTSSERLAIAGGSAGGLLMGAVANLRPDLFHVIVADVPFVDVVNTMLDPTIPLTVIEWEEWGNPTEPEYFEYMMSYSPYDNVTATDYPHMLITAGLNDPRVQYWEPAKWTARLRAHRTDDNLMILKTNMGAGHFGSSGRYGRLRELAFEFAFILDRFGIAE